MRIAFVCLGASNLVEPDLPEYPYGGAEVQSALLAPALAQRGHEVTAVTYDFGRDPFVREDGVRVVPSYPPRGGSALANLRALVRALDIADAEVVYQMIADKTTWAVGWWARRRRRRFVFAIGHDDDVTLDLRPRSALSRLLAKRGMAMADAVVAQTGEQQAKLRRVRGLESAVVPSACEVPEDLPEKTGQTVLWNARIEPWKHPERFIALAEALPGPQYVMVGGPAAGHERYGSEVIALARRAGIAAPGRVPDVAPYFDKATLFVLTSDAEGYPNTLMQAWARGAAVLSTVDPGGVLRRERIGVIAAPDQLPAAAERLLGDKAAVGRMVRRARRYVERVHSVDRAASLLERVLAGER